MLAVAEPGFRAGVCVPATGDGRALIAGVVEGLVLVGDERRVDGLEGGEERGALGPGGLGRDAGGLLDVAVVGRVLGDGRGLGLVFGG
ncbi:hypothetical protein ACWGI8_06685 [Streptomyces sp. NPDC054841]